jgi:hypothetical protein
MDLNLIKQKMAAMTATTQDREKIDYDKVFWRPTPGKHTIRILPAMDNPAYPFKELYFHYGIAKFPMLALTNWGEQDPIMDFINELKKTSDKDNWSTAGKLSPKMRVFAPVIVRGEEDQGVRLWGFGKNIYKALLALAEDEDVGDFTDVINGWDLIVEQTPGNPYPETTVRIKLKQTPLSENNTLVDKWLKEQPLPLEIYNKYDFEFIKQKLQEWLNPEETSEDTTTPTVTPSVKAPEAPSKVYSTESVASTKPNPMASFDDLFND